MSDFQEEVREASSDSLDGAKGVHHLVLSVNIRVLDTKDVDEIVGIFKNQALQRSMSNTAYHVGPRDLLLNNRATY